MSTNRPFLLAAALLCASVAAAQPALTRGVLKTNLLGGSGRLITGQSATPFTRSDEVKAMAVDGAGNIWLAGIAYSTDFPVVNSTLPQSRGPSDAFLMKLSADGNRVLFSTYFGGAEDDAALALAVDAQGQAVIAGWSESLNLPQLGGPQFNTRGKREGFVARFAADGRLLNATFLGGTENEEARAVAVDATGIYVAGWTSSPDFPALAGAVQATFRGRAAGTGPVLEPGDGFVMKIASDFSRVIYSTFLGGAGDDNIRALALRPGGQAVVGGGTNSADFPFVQGSYQSVLKGDPFNNGGDGFVAVLSPEASRVETATFFGGGQADVVQAVTVSPDGGVYAAGDSRSDDLPVLKPVQGVGSGRSFLAKFNAQLTSLVWSARLGSIGQEAGTFAVVNGPDASVYVAGTTDAVTLPARNAAQPSKGGGLSCNRPVWCTHAGCGVYSCSDAFIAAFSHDGDLRMATYLGGRGDDSGAALAVDNGGRLLVAGMPSAGFPMPFGSATNSARGGFFLSWLSPNGSSANIANNSVVNAANGQPGIAPGGLASIYGAGIVGWNGVLLASSLPLPTEMEGTQVFFDARPAPLLAIATTNALEQINIQVPFEATAPSVEVRRNGANVFATSPEFFAQAPACFTQDGTLGSFQHGVGSAPVNSAAPASRNEVLVLYCTGLGTTTPAVPTGAAAPSNPLARVSGARLTVAGTDAVVDYAGLAPGYAGLYQINFRVPATTPPGAHDVVVTVGERASRPVRLVVQ